MIIVIPNIYGLNGYPYMSVLPGFSGKRFPISPYQYNHLQHLLPTHQPGSVNLSHLMIPSALPQPVYPGLNSMQPTQPTAGAVSCPQHSETSTVLISKPTMHLYSCNNALLPMFNNNQTYQCCLIQLYKLLRCLIKTSCNLSTCQL